MNKDDIALDISREMFKQKGSIQSFNSFECTRRYFYYLSMEDLIGITSQYGIKVE